MPHLYGGTWRTDQHRSSIVTMLPWSSDLAGRLDELVIDSAALRGNPLGDPHERPLWVYVPPGYDVEPTTRYPTVYVIQGYTGHIEMWRNRSAFRRPFPETADAVFAGGAPACIVVYVDAWTAYGGSQYVDSPGTGRYHTYLCEDVVPFVDARYRTIPDRESRAITGKSSGGFGAMITPMLRPDLFGALASHAGDALYELCYLPDFGAAVRALRSYDGDPHAWWADFTSRTAFTRTEDGLLLGIYGVAACFSAEPDGTPVLPFDPVTGVLRPDVWQRWLDLDPVRMAPRPRRRAALPSVRSGSTPAPPTSTSSTSAPRPSARSWQPLGVPDERVHFELFDAGHAGIDHRYPLALEWLAHRLAR